MDRLEALHRNIGVEQEVRKMADDNLATLAKWGDEPFAEAARKEIEFRARRVAPTEAGDVTGPEPAGATFPKGRWT